MNAERQRLQATKANQQLWKKWGPYLSERQWGTVREDYSDNGDAWSYFPHDHARSRAYHWGEDGLGGISDDHQLLCFAIALWNGNDPILKERLFGLTNSEGNHGEDVKEYYFYLDSSPTHAYMKYLYKYPQQAFPYEDLVQTNFHRSRDELEYELLDTGIFDDDRYFDVFVEYAKRDPEDILIKISVANRGPDAAPIHLLPTLWFRNTWSWAEGGSKPVLQKLEGKGYSAVQACLTDELLKTRLGDYVLHCDRVVPLLFTDNETNNKRLFGSENDGSHVKDGINDYIVNGQQEAVNLKAIGTKVSAHYTLTVQPGATEVVHLRLSAANLDVQNPFDDFDSIFSIRKKETDEFYDSITPAAVKANCDRTNIFRQALAGMMWTKQYFYYDVDQWLEEHGVSPWVGAAQKSQVRNSSWYHMLNDDVISMPDKWEYPWYAAWDLAFHMLPIGLIDLDFAKKQLTLMLQEHYLHPNGQIPAYEWNFSDVNPPVHAWAIWETYVHEKTCNNGVGDVEFLKYAFSKLLINFTWWVNRKDTGGNNVFEGGFLGLDNIGVFDRSSPLPTGGYLEQADGTAWMAFFSQRMLQIAIELALYDPIYEDMAIKFFEHTMWIAGAMDRIGEHQDELWDEADGFFYDVLRFPDGSATRIKVRSMVGLLTLMAVAVFPPEAFATLPTFRERVQFFLNRYPELTHGLHLPTEPGWQGRRMLAVVNEAKLRRILAYLLDETEFLSDYGIRSLSKYHKGHPYVFYQGRQAYRVEYLPGDSNTGMFGGNSNWRGPIWMPVNLLLLRSLLQLYGYYGDDFKVECPTGSGNYVTLFDAAAEIANRLIGIFAKDQAGKRAVYGATEKFQTDPHWQDLILFYEYFHGDNGAGIGASHQTGWTGCIASIIQTSGYLTKEIMRTSGPGRFIPKQ
ncbi:MAG: MGH1-like glycoside hydrolase domain-containing protein [Thainema sp.]